MTNEKPTTTFDNDEGNVSATDAFSTLWKQTTLEEEDTIMEDTYEEKPTEINQNEWKTVEKKKHHRHRNNPEETTQQKSTHPANDSNKTNPNNKQTNDNTHDMEHNTTEENQDTKNNKTNESNKYDMNLRLSFQAENKQEASKHHMKVLRFIKRNLSLYDAYDKEDMPFDIPDADDTMSMNYFNYNQHKQKSPFVVVHRLVCNLSYGKMKRIDGMITLLKELKCRMYWHHWDTTTWDIVNMGFISGASPKHQTAGSLQTKYEQSYDNNADYKLIPTQIKLTQNGLNLFTTAYEVHCARNNFEEVCNYLSKSTQSQNQNLVLNRWRYTNIDVFAKAILKQNDFISNIRTVPVYGISEMGMNFVYEKLMERPDVLDVKETSTSETLGRWNVQTTLATFEKLTKWLETNIKRILEEHGYDGNEEPEGFSPHVRFNKTITFEKKEKDPYLENVERAVGNYTIQVQQSWASVVSGKTNNTNNTSTMTSSREYLQEIDNLQQKITHLEEKLDKIDNNSKELATRMDIAEKNNTEHIRKLTDILSVLDERSKRMMEFLDQQPKPRKLELTFDECQPSKRRDNKATPTKPSRS